MGIENREYLREDYEPNQGSRFGNTGIITRIIVATAIVFLLQVLTSRPGAGSAVTNWLELNSPDLYQRGQIWRLVTYAFCHDRQWIFHILFNMMALHTIGGMIVRLMGDREFLWFYLAGAFFAGLCSVVFYSLIGISPSIVGASGAVYAVFCLAAMHYPRVKLLLFGVFPIEMRWLLAGFVAMDLFPILTGRSTVTQVAHSAHLGGLLFGFLYFRWDMRLTRWWDNFAGRFARKRRSRNLKIFAPATPPESGLDEQVDRILEKIHREGEASLTARERNILTQASRQLRKNRP